MKSSRNRKDYHESNFYYVDDNILQIHAEDEEMSDEEAQAWYENKILPLLYQKKK